MGQSITTYIEDLFKYLKDYESDYSTFEAEAFFQTYNGVCAVFQALREQRDKAVEVDRVFLEKIKQRPLNSSDLRQLTVQIIISFFESVADTDGQSNRAYMYCREFRNVKRDVAYFETFLMPLLTREGSLNNNFKLNHFFLKEIGRFIRTFGSSSAKEVNFEDFKGMPVYQKLLTLHMRRAELGDGVANDRDSLEHHMRNTGVFDKLKHEGSLPESYLREWNYLIEESFMDRLKESLSEAWGKLKGFFSSFNYVRLALAQRYSGYMFYGLIMVLFILLAFLVPKKWMSYSQSRLAEFEQRVEETMDATGR
ncbi:MAG: hypothetical protein KAV42_09270 [Candidatus Krumholzibacteria bacterium]|nr:hypothetical protein [Candidatus Krumholzibacteria bacterium]